MSPSGPRRRNRRYKGFADIFKVGRNGKSFSLPVTIYVQIEPGRMNVRCFRRDGRRSQVYERLHWSCVQRHGYIPSEPIRYSPRVFAFEGWDLGRLGEEFDAI